MPGHGERSIAQRCLAGFPLDRGQVRQARGQVFAESRDLRRLGRQAFTDRRRPAQNLLGFAQPAHLEEQFPQVDERDRQLSAEGGNVGSVGRQPLVQPRGAPECPFHLRLLAGRLREQRGQSGQRGRQVLAVQRHAGVAVDEHVVQLDGVPVQWLGLGEPAALFDNDGEVRGRDGLGQPDRGRSFSAGQETCGRPSSASLSRPTERSRSPSCS